MKRLLFFIFLSVLPLAAYTATISPYAISITDVVWSAGTPGQQVQINAGVGTIPTSALESVNLRAYSKLTGEQLVVSNHTMTWTHNGAGFLSSNTWNTTTTYTAIAALTEGDWEVYIGINSTGYFLKR